MGFGWCFVSLLYNKNMKTISLVIPAYNEEDSLETLFLRLTRLTKKLAKYNFEFILVDDGSADKTLEILKKQAKEDSRFRYVSLSRNFGKEIAMLAGLDHVTGDASIILDADLQNPPELIEEMLGYWEEGYDDVYGKRVDREGESWFKKTATQLFYKLLQINSSVPVQINVGDFRLLDKRCVEALCQLRENHRYTKGLYSWIGYNKKALEYQVENRVAGETKWNYKRLFNFALDGLVSFSINPLRLASLLGLPLVGLSIISFIFKVFRFLFGRQILTGFPELTLLVVFLGGIQLLSVGILGEYIGRILMEVKNRPLYLVKESNLKAKKKD